jgi:WD repeat-containing protein 76
MLVIGNMNRSVNIFNAKGEQMAVLSETKLTAIPAVNVFHPSLPMIVSGNASGRMNIWK